MGHSKLKMSDRNRWISCLSSVGLEQIVGDHDTALSLGVAAHEAVEQMIINLEKNGMKELKYLRKGKNITSVATDKVEQFDSINLAKKKSRTLQPISGDGTLKVVR